MMLDREELNHWLRLCTTQGIGPATARKLLKAFGLPSAIWSQSHTALSQLVTAAQANALSREPEDLAALTEDTWNWLLTPLAPTASL